MRRWNGSSWVEVGTGSAAGGGISNNSGSSEWPSLALDAGGVPYLSWFDNSSGDDEIYVRRYQGGAWQEVGDGSASGGGTSDNIGDSQHPALIIDTDGVPYVAWHDDSSSDDEIYVRRWEE